MNATVGDGVVQEFAQRVRSLLGAKLHAIYLFGSRARVEAAMDSDYDLLLETSVRLASDERDRVADITVDLSGRNRVILDVHYDLCGRMHGARRFLTPFRARVLSDGVLL
ncbi:MAG: nucleotidyltransferase domain-containing protein [Verrucomicrobiota bacterium]|nr:nucleotidyltransferase domain-containing protein [Verrucomicrobiota bacterium]